MRESDGDANRQGKGERECRHSCDRLAARTPAGNTSVTYKIKDSSHESRHDQGGHVSGLD